jgi:hypothetical protein
MWQELSEVIVNFERNAIRQLTDAQAGDVAAFRADWARTRLLNARVRQLGHQAGFDLTSPCAAVL